MARRAAKIDDNQTELVGAKMAVLTGCSDAAFQIVQALGLPEGTVALTLKIRAGEVALLEVEMFADEKAGEELATIIKRYRLEELELTEGPVPEIEAAE